MASRSAREALGAPRDEEDSSDVEDAAPLLSKAASLPTTLFDYERVHGPPKPIVPIADLPLPGEPHGRVPPRTIRFRYEGPSELLPSQGEPQSTLVESLLLQLQQQFATLTQPTVTLPRQHGDVRLIDITFDTCKQLAMGRRAKLTFAEHRLTRFSCGLPLEKTDHSIVIAELSRRTDMGRLIKYCIESLEPYGQIREAWAQTSRPRTQPSQDFKFTGRLVCLFRRKDETPLPSWLDVAFARHPLLYGDKYKYCTECESEAADDHGTAACPSRRNARESGPSKTRRRD